MNLFETFEVRRLMAVSIPAFMDGGVIRVNGTNRSDQIVVTINPNASPIVLVSIQGYTKSFNGMQGIVVNGGSGSDTITVKGNGPIPDGWGLVELNGGDGKDRLVNQNYEGRIWLVGDAGDDVLDATQGLPKGFEGDYFDLYNTMLSGGDGADLLLGGEGRDLLYAGDGNDTAIGNNGHDVLVGGRGVNYLYGGNGDDRFGVMPSNSYSEVPEWWTTGGSDYIFGGNGVDDVVYIFNSKNPISPVYNETCMDVVEILWSDDFAPDL